jgi:beta-phosphoglucomutase-like phosphatase (HAD superfamily)
MPKRINNLFIDMDNSLVPYDSDPDHHWIDYVTGTIIQTAMDLDISKKLNTFRGNRALAERIAQDSFKQHGQSIIGLALQMGIDASILSEAYHERLNPKKYINPNEEHTTNLKSFTDWLLRSEINYVLFTQASRTNAERVIEHLGLTDIFNQENMVTSTDFPNNFKHNSEDPYRVAFNRLVNGAHPANTMIIDDSRSVLKKAFEVGTDYWGQQITTCQIDHGNIDPNPAAYIKHSVRNIGEVPALVNHLNG